MAASFLHGVEVLEIDSGSRPIQTVATSVIGIVGTAPDATPEAKATLSLGTAAANTGLTFTSKLTGVNGNSIAVRYVAPSTASQALAVSVSNKVITVSLATSAASAVTTTAALAMAAINAHADASALVTAAALGTSTGAGVLSASPSQFLSGGVDEAFPINKPTLIAGSVAEAAKLGSTGTLPDALDSILDQTGAVVVVVRVEEGADDAETLANVLGGVNATDGSYEGLYAFLGAETAVKVRPRILIAPGFTHTKDNGNANPVVAELLGVATRLRAVIFADGPDTTDAEALAYAQDFDSRRIYVIDPWVLKVSSDNGETFRACPSAIAAGLQAKSDNDRGFWWSLSNQTINGIVGTTRDVDFSLGDASSRANLLNAGNVATIIHQNGYRLWGNRTLSSDSKWTFLSVGRTADIINDSVLSAHLWAVDRNITRTYLEDVENGVNDYLRTLVTLEAILGGECWADQDLNTAANIAQGHVYFNFDFTPAYPAERVTFQSLKTDDYISELF